MKEKIAIIYQTFLRDDLMRKTFKSIMLNWHKDYVLLVGDQNKGNRRLNVSDRFGMSNRQINYYQLPYDCGLSYARNFLVNKAHDMGIKYCLVTADSIEFTDKYDFEQSVEMLEYYPKLAKIGFQLENRQDFTYDLEIHPKHNKFVVIKPRRVPFLTNNVEYTPCDLCSNFFIAKTAVLKEIDWDNDLKLCLEEKTPILIKNGDKMMSIPIKNLWRNVNAHGDVYKYKSESIKVWTNSGWQVVRNISRSIKSNLLRIKTPSAYIETTPDHRYIVDNKEIEAQELKINDKIQLCEYPDLSNRLKVNLDFAWMLGFFLAEGTCKSGKKRQKRIEFTNQNIEELRRCESVFHSLGIETAWYIKRGRKDKCSFLRVKHPDVFNSYFKEFYYNDTYYCTKIIPYYVYDFDKMARQSFIQGFLDGDGYKKLPGHFSQKSGAIVNGLFLLASDLDYKSFSINNNSNNCGEWFVGALKVHKTDNQNIINKKESIINKNTYVYDIECDTHRFCAGIGNILVHNCEHEDHCYRLKQAGYETLWTNDISATYINDKPDEYKQMRTRLYSEFKAILKKKYNFDQAGSWLCYNHKLPKEEQI